jgi:YVTN family beta-propeller protein
MEYRVLGPLEVRHGEESLPLGGHKQRALLALLLLNANRVVSRDRLIDTLWEDEPPETAVQSLQVYVSRLRKMLPTETLITCPPGYRLEVAADELDLQRFKWLVGEAREAVARDDTNKASALLRDALALWRGAALEEFACDSFAKAEIGRLEGERLCAVEDRIDAELRLGRHAEVIGELEKLIAENPHRERLRGQLMLALYRSGRQAEALAAYQDARCALVEIGIEPSPGLQRLEKAILTHDESLVAPSFARPVGTRRPPTRRRRLVAAAALVVTAAIAGAVFLATRTSSAIMVPPNSLAIIDARTNKFIGSVAVGSRPDGVASDSRRGSLVGVWVANVDDKTLSLVDPQGRHDVSTVPLEAQGTPTGLAVGFGAVWVVHGGLGTVSRVALNRPRVETIHPPVWALVGGSAAFGSIGRGDWSMWVAVGDQVSRIDPRSRDWVATTIAGQAPSAIAYGLGAVWVANEVDGTVTPIFPPDERLSPALEPMNPIKVGRRPNGVTVGGGAVWVTNEEGDTVSRIDPASRLATKVPVGRAPLGIAYGAGAVWVANSGDGTISRIDPARGKVVATIHIGNSPRRIAVGGGKVWVTVQAA